MKRYFSIFLCLLTCLLCIACGKPDNPTSAKSEPVIIAVIDTGISTKGIDPNSVLSGKNYIDPNLTTDDTYGHGTAVASVILKNTPDVKLLPLVSNAYSDGEIIQVDNDVLAGMIKDAVDVFDCDIINLSAGLILDKPAIREAVLYAEQNGVLVVASVGNDYATDGDFKYYPAGYETVMAVGSTNREGTAVSDFSQRGEWVDIYARGEGVEITTLSGSKRESDGTSYSAAYVTAYAAKLLQEDNTLSPDRLREKLLSHTKQLPDGKKVLIK